LKIIIRLLVFIGIVALIAALILGYFGLIPVVSRIFGSDKPRDLGVTFIQEDFNSGMAKTGKEYVLLPSDLSPEESLKYSGTRVVKTSFTDKELTALTHNRPWKYYPVKDVQLKIHEDGMVEASGVILVDRIIPGLKAFGVDSDQAESVMTRLDFLKTNPPFYIKGTGSIINNELDLDIKNLEIGRLPVPSWFFGGENSSVSMVDVINFIEARLKTISGLSIKSLTLKEGKLFFDGTLPATEAYSP